MSAGASQWQSIPAIPLSVNRIVKNVAKDVEYSMLILINTRLFSFVAPIKRERRNSLGCIGIGRKSGIE